MLPEIQRMGDVPGDLSVSEDSSGAHDHGEHSTIKEHAGIEGVNIGVKEVDVKGRGECRTASTNKNDNLFMELPTTSFD